MEIKIRRALAASYVDMIPKRFPISAQKVKERLVSRVGFDFDLTTCSSEECRIIINAVERIWGNGMIIKRSV